MAAIAMVPDDLRLEAARIAFALMRFEEHVAQPGLSPSNGDYIFTPSLRRVPRHEVESFLAGLPSPALLSPTTIQGIVALTLVHELGGDRLRGAEKILGNFTVMFDDMCRQLGLTDTSRILLELDGETHLLSSAGARLWTQQFAVQVGWNMRSLEGDPRAQARLCIRRSDGHWSWDD